MKPIDIYLMWGSQPARAVVALCELAKLPYNAKSLNFPDLKSPEFTKINPDQKVPVIVDHENNFTLFESHSIMKYLVSSRPQMVDQKLYPVDDYKIKAKLDEYLDWHHTGLRGCARFVFTSIFAKQFNVPTLTNDTDELKRQMEKALKLLDTYYLGDKKYITGLDYFTIADISAYCEVVQLRLLAFNYDSYPNIKEWMAKMEQLEAIQKSHVIFNKMVRKRLQQTQQNAKL